MSKKSAGDLQNIFEVWLLCYPRYGISYIAAEEGNWRHMLLQQLLYIEGL